MPGREGGREGGLSVDDWLVYVSESISYAAAIKEFHISKYFSSPRDDIAC